MISSRADLFDLDPATAFLGTRSAVLHAVCDAKGRPHVLLLTPGNVHDCKVARQWLIERGTEPIIPPRKNRKVQYEYDRAIYKQRNAVERMFCRFKD